MALLILGYTLWLLFGLGAEARRRACARVERTPGSPALVLALIFMQMLAGALVAGLDAGMGFNTWPLINGAFVPTGLGEASPWYLNLFENPLTVQFDHRMLGYAVVLAALGQLAWLAREGSAAAAHRQRADAGAVRRAASDARRLDAAARRADRARARPSGRRHRRVRRRALSFLARAPRAEAAATPQTAASA